MTRANNQPPVSTIDQPWRQPGAPASQNAATHHLGDVPPTMTAHQLIEKEKIETRQIQTPQPGPGAVLVRARAAGVCETDLHIFRASFGLKNVPLTLGHEFAGEIAKIGPGVTDLAIGDRVTVEPCIVCGECRFCKSGRSNLCVKLNHLGIDSDGAFGDYVVVPSRNAHRLPDNASWLDGALCEPLGCAHHALTRARLARGEDIVIIGDGFFGSVFTQMAKAMGARKAVVIGHHADRLERVRAEGTDLAFDERESDPTAMTKDLGDGYGPDVVIDTVGAKDSFPLAIRIAGQGGRVTLFGAVGKQYELLAWPILGKELDVLGALSSSDSWPAVIELLGQGKLHPERLITQTLPLTELSEAFLLKASRDSGVIR